MRTKNIYRGAFNLNKNVFIFYAHAYTERQAWLVFCKRLADKHGLSVGNVINYFNGEKNNYEITKEVEFKEDEE